MKVVFEKIAIEKPLEINEQLKNFYKLIKNKSIFKTEVSSTQKTSVQVKEKKQAKKLKAKIKKKVKL